MHVIMDILITTKTKGGRQISLRKKHETSLYPIPGIKIEDSAWAPSFKVPADISCNFDEEYYILSFKNVLLDTDGVCEEEEKMYRIHGWESLNEIEVK
jgi:hypothetical protein